MYTQDDLLPSRLCSILSSASASALSSISNRCGTRTALRRKAASCTSMYMMRWGIERQGEDRKRRASTVVAFGVDWKSRCSGIPLDSIADAFHARWRVAASSRKTTWLPFPVEHKRGKPKPDDCDRVQLCAQALCLEEMLGMEVPSGAIFYGRTRRRLDVEFDGHLRDQTEKAAARLHQMVELGATPPPVYTKKCLNCSLNDRCLPRVFAKTRRVRDYLLQALEGE